jgi:hypothetical protein
MGSMRSNVSSEESSGVGKCLFWNFNLLCRITPGILWDFCVEFDFDFGGTLDNSMSSSESAS